MIFSFSILFTSCNKSLQEGTIIFTQVSGNLENNNNVNSYFGRLITGSQIMALSPDKTDEKPKWLTKGYFSACSPTISNDGKSMVFTAQKNQKDVWQIFKMDLGNLKIVQITSAKENCLDPTFLPDGQLLYSKFTKEGLFNQSFSLYTYNFKENKSQQITFKPHAYYASTILHDGRILTVSKQLYPAKKVALFMALRPDGTKEELFYKSPKEHPLFSRAYEVSNHKVAFIESDSSSTQGGNIIAINYNRPLHSRENLSSKIKGLFYALYPQKEDKWLVTYKPSSQDKFALFEFNSENKTLGKSLYKDADFNVLQVVVVKKHKRARILPSEIKLGAPAGLLLCQNINAPRLMSNGKESSSVKASKIEILGIESSLGTVAVEDDGSFYLNIVANTPFRLQTLSKDGKIIKGPSSWIYVRPNERRGCVGCHTDNEQVPENRQPLAVKKSPQKVPVPFNEVNKIKGP